MFTREKVFLIINIVLLGIFCSTDAFAGPGYPSDKTIKEDLAKYLVNFQEKKGSVKGSVRVKFLSFERRLGKELQMLGTYYVVSVKAKVELKHDFAGVDRTIIPVEEIQDASFDGIAYAKTDRGWLFEDAHYKATIEKETFGKLDQKFKVKPPVYYIGERWDYHMGDKKFWSEDEIIKTEGKLAAIVNKKSGIIFYWDQEKGKFTQSLKDGKETYAYEYNDLFKGESLYVGKNIEIKRDARKIRMLVEAYEPVKIFLKTDKLCSAFRIRKIIEFSDKPEKNSDSYAWYCPNIKNIVRTRLITDKPNIYRWLLTSFSVKGINMD